MTRRGPRPYLAAMRPAACVFVTAAAALGAGLLAGCAFGGRGARPASHIQVASVQAIDVKVLVLLMTGRGSLIIRGGETDSLTVRSAVSTATAAGRYRVPVETVDKGDSLLVTTSPSAAIRIDLQMDAPEDLAVNLMDEGRDVILRNVENRVDVVRHLGGSLDLEDIEGPLAINDGPGPIRVHDVRGPIAINDGGGEVSVSEVQNSLRIESRGGDVTVENVEGDVIIRAGPGRLTVRSVGGRLSYRKAGAGQVRIEGIAGGVQKL